MRALCCFLLRLSPSRFRRDFSDEVLEIIALRFHEEGRSFGFVMREIWGLVLLAWSLWSVPTFVWPVLGGVAGAVLGHYALYSATAGVALAGSEFLVARSAEPFLLAIFAGLFVLSLLPVFLILSYRIRHARTHRSLKAL